MSNDGVLGSIKTDSTDTTNFLRKDGTFANPGGGLVVGTTPITSGTNQRVLYQDSGVLTESGNLTFDGNVLIPNICFSTTGFLALNGGGPRVVCGYSFAGIKIGGTTGNLVYSGNDDCSSEDSGVARVSAGLLEVNNGTKGTLADLTIRCIRHKALTVATLPTGVAGMSAYVTDGDAGLAWGATVVNTGAGATKYFVWFNGTNWTVMGK